MIAAGSRLRQIGWVVILAICLAGFVALTFRVNAVKSEVRLAERRIIQLEREKLLLETEVETRANQQQLASWNALEFGYEAPRADQYLESERQLAALGTPRAIGAPSASINQSTGDSSTRKTSPRGRKWCKWSRLTEPTASGGTSGADSRARAASTTSASVYRSTWVSPIRIR